MPTARPLAHLVTAVLLATALFGCAKNGAGDTIYRDGQPPVSMVEDGDPEMEAAMQKAKDSIQEFITALEEPGEKLFSIKVGLPTPDDSVEHIWVDIESYKEGVFQGELGNNPLNLPDRKLGDLIEVKMEKVEDWIIMDGEKKVGGYTAKLLQEREDAKQ